VKDPGTSVRRALSRRDLLRFVGAAAAAGCADALFPGTLAAQAEQVPQRIADLFTLLAEDWQEPWIWRPEDWPGSLLELNVVRKQNPGPSTSPGNRTPSLFNFNGSSPGPTVRVRGDGVLRIRLRNTLGLNEQETPVGPCPDVFEVPGAVQQDICGFIEQSYYGGDPAAPGPCPPYDTVLDYVLEALGAELRPGWSLKDHLNGQHAAHVTNLHLHGLHVAPQTNADGTHSDNVFLRLLPRADWQARRASGDPALQELAEYEHVGELEYEIRLPFERDGDRMPHPPGTHWYHPHPHGATHDQVTSGMAGFLIVEGDVDEAINRAMTGDPWPDPEARSGPFDYRERLVFLQRVEVTPADLDAPRRRRNLRSAQPFLARTGPKPAGLMVMRPGAVERWRVLNASVDGSGTKRFMVLDGEFEQQGERLMRVSVSEDGSRQLTPTTQQDLEDAKLPLQQIAFDGITLVSEQNGRAVHTIKDLSQQNAGTQHPFALPAEQGGNPFRARLRAFEACFRDGDSLRRTFVRPNEVYLTNANRTDLFFKAPLDAAGKTFTVFAQEAHVQTDGFQHSMQNQIANPDAGPPLRPTFDVVMAHIKVVGEPVEGGDFDIQSLRAHLPPVPPLLRPVREQELRVPRQEAVRTGVEPGSARTRVISYSGTGGTDFPSIPVPEEFAQQHPELENVVWARFEGTAVLLPNYTRTMAINGQFDLASGEEPGLPHKFSPDDPTRPRVLLNTAEEWVLYNNSQVLWAHTDRERFPQPGSYGVHYYSYPLPRHEGQRRFAEDPEFRITSKGSDHPFHIHINPMWVLRIDVPDENGELHNVLPEPRWMDTVWIPRNGGRVVFRSRFEDFTGDWVHHCHILLHEDMGMMQRVECTERFEDANYRPRATVASARMSSAEVGAIYPPPTADQMYRQNLSFIDPTELGYQVYPGFDLAVPKLDDEEPR
jgi:FtsP/CotA-like multicopper oxidase with cupredoxin domain